MQTTKNNNRKLPRVRNKEYKDFRSAFYAMADWIIINDLVAVWNRKYTIVKSSSQVFYYLSRYRTTIANLIDNDIEYFRSRNNDFRTLWNYWEVLHNRLQELMDEVKATKEQWEIDILIPRTELFINIAKGLLTRIVRQYMTKGYCYRLRAYKNPSNFTVSE